MTRIKSMSSLREIHCAYFESDYNFNFQLPQLTHISTVVSLCQDNDDDRLTAFRFLKIAPNAVSVVIYGDEYTR